MARSEVKGDTHPNDDLLIALHDGALFPGDRPVVEQHLKECARCRNRLAVLTTAPPKAAAAPKPAPVRKASKPASPRVARRIALAAVVIGALAGGVTFVQRELARRSAAPVTLASAPSTPDPQAPPSITEIPTPPAPAATAPAEAASEAAAPAPTITSELPPEPIEIASPNRNFRWRIVGLEVERTTDGGKTWRKQMVELRQSIVAGVSPSAAVCWLVGKGGIAYLGVGPDWKQAALTQPSDLVSVAAIDSMNATATAADGRQFSTSDGGANWAVVP